MKILLAEISQLDSIMVLYDRAKDFMAKSGNSNQWINGYPQREIIEEDINRRCLYVCIDGNDEILAAFYFAIENDSTYDIIWEGEWLNAQPYGVVHRLVSSGKQRRIGDYCMEWCFKRHPNIRVDTHKDNKTMQDVLNRLNYKKCGVIKIKNGSLRIAFQKT